MRKGETGLVIGSALVGIVGAFALFSLAEGATSPLGSLVLRVLAITVPPVVCARVGYSTGFNAGRESARQSAKLRTEDLPTGGTRG